ncbi:MAG: DUF2341 domain-containing protein [Desulfurococcales archaeon]|nr:DUF2341 domain-containing protein [Desulfurococcales archaeon]
MNTLSQQDDKAVSTVIATLFMLLILFSLLTYIYLEFRHMEGTIQTVNTALLRRTEASKLKLDLINIQVNNTYITLTLRNTGTRNALLIKYYIRDLDTEEIQTGQINDTIPIQETQTIYLHGTYNSAHKYLIVLIDIKGGILKYTYPQTKPPTGGVNYTIKYLPTILEGYTTATRGYNLSNTETASYDNYLVLEKSNETSNPLTVQAEQTTLYTFPEYKDWKYYKTITIQNNGPAINGYTILIQLNSTNFNFSKANQNGTDLRFIAQDKITPLNYWIEYWNSTNSTARIWVKLNLPSNQNTTIYMLYGNPSVTNYDSIHYGLTKVMTQLPANDEPGVYQIQYQTWDMNQNLFNSSIGSNYTTLYGDNYTVFPLPSDFSFPYYNTTITGNIYICSNGFLTSNQSVAEALCNQDSENSSLEANEMISPLWTHIHKYFIFFIITKQANVYNSSYNDVFGKGMLIRWNLYGYISLSRTRRLTIFYTNFSVVLYENGLIRFDYGENRENINTNDDSPVVGISLGNNYQYTIISNSTENLEDWNYSNSVMFWPRKKAVIEPSIIDISADKLNAYTGYIVSVMFNWSIAPSYVYDLENNLTFSGSGSFNYWVMTSDYGVWHVLLDKPVNSSVFNVSVDMFYPVNPVVFIVNVTSDSLFNVSFNDLKLYFGEPVNGFVGVVSNSSSMFLIYSATSGFWLHPFNISMSNPMYPSVAFDSEFFRWIISNGTDILVYYPFNSTEKILAQLPAPAGDGSFIASINGFITYAPGGGSNRIYVLDGSTGNLLDTTVLPEGVTAYTCTAVDYDNSVLYVYFGSTGDLYKIGFYSNGTPYYARINITPASPTVYPVGMDYYNGRLWVIGRGGGIHVIDVSTGVVSPLANQLPYYPMTEGDRLVYIDGYLYHIREDGTSELWVFPAG